MSTSPLFRWQVITIVTLWLGYAGYYVCRSNLSVAAPAIQAELAAQEDGLVMVGISRLWNGITGREESADAAADDVQSSEARGKSRYGMMVSLGVLLYAVGKFVNGVVCDFVGGRRILLLGMVGSVVCTVLFGIGTTFVVLLSAWSANRLIQSMGWGGVVKVSSRWFPAHRHGTILSILCLSYLFGDALSRLFLGALLGAGLSWRGLFFAAAGTLAVIAIACRFLLKDSPSDVGAQEPVVNPRNLYGSEGDAPRPAGVAELLWPFVTSLSFWLLCVMSFGLTFIRETFNAWFPTYLHEVVEMPTEQAASVSALFPFIGGLSALAAGFLTDYVARGRRGIVLMPFLALLVVALFALARLEAPESAFWPLVLISAVSFSAIGPYTFLSGVMSLDFGGKRGSSTAAGLADTAGYLGGVLSGYWIAQLVETTGWSGAFRTLGITAVATFAAAIGYWVARELIPAWRGANGAGR